MDESCLEKQVEFDLQERDTSHVGKIERTGLSRKGETQK
jgi:hypothetical protein